MATEFENKLGYMGVQQTKNQLKCIDNPYCQSYRSII